MAVALFKVEKKVNLMQPQKYFWVGDESDVGEAEYVIHVGVFERGGRDFWRVEDSVLFRKERVKKWIEDCETKFGESFGIDYPRETEMDRKKLKDLSDYVEHFLKKGEEVPSSVYGLPSRVLV